MLLSVDGVTAEFQARKGLLGSVPVRALDGVSLRLERGETAAFSRIRYVRFRLSQMSEEEQAQFLIRRQRATRER